FTALASDLKAEWHFRQPNHKTPAAILVTREAHCFHDLIARTSSGELPLEIRTVLSNHESLREAAENAGLSFRYVPIRKECREAYFAIYQEAIEESSSELIVLARFMQILPASFCAAYDHRAINIHHSFLPAFIGANPYRQA